MQTPTRPPLRPIRIDPPPLAAEDGFQAFHDEEDPDAIIPDHLARPLLFSSNLMLLTAYLAARIDAWLFAATAVLVWVTSLLHWSSPRFTSWRRYADYSAVISLVVVGSWLVVSRARSSGWVALFFAGLTAIGLLFAMNETLYFLQLQRTPSGAFSPRRGAGGGGGAGGDRSAFPGTKVAALACMEPVAPGSAACVHVYRRTAWVHLLCVHGLASVLADVLLLYGIE